MTNVNASSIVDLNTFKRSLIACTSFPSYLIYLAISVIVTIWVARTLHNRGRVFLVDAFEGREPLADSVNDLLVVGFYLINVGYVTLALKSVENPVTLRQAIEMLSDKLGLVLLVLGLMHFFNLFVFSRIRKRGLRNQQPPYPPAFYMPPNPPGMQTESR